MPLAEKGVRADVRWSVSPQGWRYGRRVFCYTNKDPGLYKRDQASEAVFESSNESDLPQNKMSTEMSFWKTGLRSNQEAFTCGGRRLRRAQLK